MVTLSDVNMPGMDRLTLLGEVRKRFRDLPVMMVTAYGDDERPAAPANRGLPSSSPNQSTSSS
ncbi:MAG: hypothetical protein WA633_18165 [Stellaceae bacterium]